MAIFDLTRTHRISGIAVSILLVLNLILLFCVVGLRRELEASVKTTQQLAGDLRFHKAELAKSKAKPPVQPITILQAAPPTPTANVMSESAAHNLPSDEFIARPNIEETPILDEASFGDIIRRRARMPRYIKAAPLRHGDIDSLLRDEEWNPSGRELDREERAQLVVLLNDFRFYSEISPRERFEDVILPIVDSMREDGQGIPYPSDSPPPAIDGQPITHSESTDDPAVNVLYAFSREDYPELHHDRTVEDQRKIEKFVQIYELINHE